MRNRMTCWLDEGQLKREKIVDGGGERGRMKRKRRRKKCDEEEGNKTKR
jgi:hypothetical protein